MPTNTNTPTGQPSLVDLQDLFGITLNKFHVLKRALRSIYEQGCFDDERDGFEALFDDLLNDFRQVQTGLSSCLAERRAA
jgi:hypothetical protein